MEHAVPAHRRHRPGALIAVQGLCLFAAGGTAAVQLALLHAATASSVTFPLPLPAEAAQTLFTAAALLVVLLLDLLLLSPFYLGVTAFRYDSGSAAPAPVSACFAAYRRRRYRLALRWRLTMWLVRGGSGLLCLLPALFLFGRSDALSAEKYAVLAAPLCRAAGSLLAVGGGIVWGLWMLRYAAAGFFVPETGSVREALRRSSHVIRPHRGALVRLYLRFSGGFLSCVLILPAPVVLPLFYRALARQVREWVSTQRLPEKHLL